MACEGPTTALDTLSQAVKKGSLSWKIGTAPLTRPTPFLDIQRDRPCQKLATSPEGPPKLLTPHHYPPHLSAHPFHHPTRHYIKERQLYLLMTKASNAKTFWKKLDSVGIRNDKNNSKELSTSIQKEDGTMTTGNEGTIITWRNHFDTLLNPNSTDPSSMGAQSCDNCPSTDNDALNRPIKLEEQLAIAQLQENKAPGPDNICPSIIINDRVLRYLHKLFQK